jgi:hypothetical protein
MISLLGLATACLQASTGLTPVRVAAKERSHVKKIS